jgi:hypothetical protein
MFGWRSTSESLVRPQRRKGVDERTRLYAEFTARFACDALHGSARPCDPFELDRVEEALETYLPASYRQFLATHGPVFVPDLWEAILERELGAHPLREFLSPDQVVTDTRLYWSGGMPRDFVGVAGDFMGNLFGFRRAAIHGVRPDDLPVSLFDHDYVRVAPVAASFDGWLRWFMDHVQKV